MENEIKTTSGKIIKYISDSCIAVGTDRDNTLYSQFGGIEEIFAEGDFIEFSFKTKEKYGRFYNNIIQGSMIKKEMPAKIIPLDTNTLIVRQNSLSHATALVLADVKSVENVPHDVLVTEILRLAEIFEKWVWR